jgi:large subunit ribosomal protein L17
MRHSKHKNQLGVKKEHREALMSNLAIALIKHGQIKTTLKKAKALRPYVEKIITMSKKAKTAASPERAVYLRRLAASRMRDKEAVKELFNNRVTEFMDRSGGYTRIYKLGNRLGDAAELALIELIKKEDPGYKKSRKAKQAKPNVNHKKESPQQASQQQLPIQETTESSAQKDNTGQVS